VEQAFTKKRGEMENLALASLMTNHAET